MGKALKESYKIAHDIRIQNNIEKLNSKIAELDNKKYYNHTSRQIPSKVESDQEVKVEQKAQEIQNSVSAFISKSNTKTNRLALTNLAKKSGVKVVITETRGKDNILKQAPKENADKFNEFLSDNIEKITSYGVHLEPYKRKYNKGGKTL